MKKVTNLLFVFFVFGSFLILNPNGSKGQSNPYMDSLWRVQKDTNQPDSIRLNALGQFSYYAILEDSLRGKFLFDSAVLTANKKHLSTTEAMILNEQGAAYLNLSAYGNAMLSYEKMLIVSENSGYESGKGFAFYGKGLTLYYQGKYQESLEFQEEAKNIFTKLDDRKRLGVVYNNIASSYLNLGNYPAAFESYKFANQKATELGDTENIIRTMGNMGMVYKNMRKLDEAKELYKKARQMAFKSGDSLQIAAMEQKIGTILDSQDSTELALEYYFRAMEINKTIQNKKGIAENVGNIGLAYFELEQWDSAWDYLNKAILVNKEQSDRRVVSNLMDTLGDLLTSAPLDFLSSIGYSQKSAQEKAISLHQEALLEFVDMGASLGQAGAMESLAKIYQSRGEYEKGFSMLMDLIAVKNSIFSDDTKEKILETEMRYQKEQDEAVLLAKHEAELKQQRLIRYMLGFGSLGLLFVFGGIFYFFQKKKAITVELDKANLKTSLAKMENRALRSQMNPHFIFNALNSIAYYVRNNEGKVADDFLVKFAKLMRKVLENSEKGEVSLADDLETLTLYLQLEQLRTLNKFKFQISIHPDIDQEEIFVPPLLLQPFVENSIWHGIMPKDQSGEIQIRIAKKEGFLECIVSDDGVGISHTLQSQIKDSLASGQSMGTRITKERLDLLEKQVGKAGRFELIPLAQGTMAKIFIPLAQDEFLPLNLT